MGETHNLCKGRIYIHGDALILDVQKGAKSRRNRTNGDQKVIGPQEIRHIRHLIGPGSNPVCRMMSDGFAPKLSILILIQNLPSSRKLQDVKTQRLVRVEGFARRFPHVAR